MPIIQSSIIFCFVLFHLNDAFAGAAVQKQQQMKAMQEQAQQQAYAQAYQQAQEQAQQQAYQQAVAQKQQQESMAYQQAAAQQQAAQMQAARNQIMQIQSQQMIQSQINAYVQKARLAAVEQAQLKQAVEQQLAQQVAAQIQQGQSAQIQEAFVAKTVADAARAIAGKQAMEAVQAVGAAQEYSNNQALVAGAAAVRSQRPSANEMVQDIVDIAELWGVLEKTSKAWALIIDDQSKSMTVNEFIERFRREGVRIVKSPMTYAQMIDDMSTQNPALLAQPFKDLLMLVAVMEYDFENGLDKDMMAHKMLGDDFYRKNRQRLGK